MSELKRLARVRSSELLFQKLEAAKLGTAELEEFFIGVGRNKKGGINRIGHECKEVALASLLKDKRRDLNKENRHCELLYHRSKEAFRSVSDSESKFRKEMVRIREECTEYRTEIDKKNLRKYEHLKKKYRGELILGLDPSLTRYGDLPIFTSLGVDDNFDDVHEQHDDKYDEEKHKNPKKSNNTKQKQKPTKEGGWGSKYPTFKPHKKKKKKKW